ASVIVDVLLQATSQLAFAIVGLTLLIDMGGNELIVWPVAIGIAFAVPALGGFLLAQRHFGQRVITKVLSAFAGDRNWLVFGAVDELFVQLNVLYSNRVGLVRSVT